MAVAVGNWLRMIDLLCGCWLPSLVFGFVVFLCFGVGLLFCLVLFDCLVFVARLGFGCMLLGGWVVCRFVVCFISSLGFAGYNCWLWFA